MVSAPTQAGTAEPAAQHLARGRPPRQGGRHRHEEQQRQPEREGHPVEVRLAHRQLLVPQRLDQEREDRAEQHHEGEGGEEEVVGQEGAFPGDGGVDPARRPQPVTPPGDEPDPGDGGQAPGRRAARRRWPTR